MTGHFTPIDPNRGVVVDSPEVQDGTPAPPVLGDPDRAAVPDGLVEVGIPDARQLRLRAEGDSDPLGQLGVDQAALESAVARVEGELPGAVESEPVVPDEAGARVLGAGDAGVLGIGMGAHFRQS